MPLHLAGHRRGAVNVPVSGTSFATKAGFVLDAARPVCVLAETVEEAQRAIRGLHSVAFFDIPGYVLGGGDERTDAVDVDELEALIAAGVKVIDVREKDERDTGYIPGSRNIPYRLVGHVLPDLPADRPVVTICESGARAADRGEHPPRARLRRPTGRRRWHDRVAPAWRRDVVEFGAAGSQLEQRTTDPPSGAGAP